MKLLKNVFLLLLIVIISLSIYVATIDGKYDVKRSHTIKAPIEVVFNEINDFKNWENWGPWYELDSTIVASFPEITSGINASYTWTGADGNGSMKTLSLIPNKEIIQQIDFGMGSTPEVYWNFDKTEFGTEVSWGMRGKNGFMEKAYFLTQGGIEKSMAPMYTRGLELLEKHLLKELEKHSIYVKGVVDHGGGFYLYQTTSCKMEDISEKMDEMFPAIMKYMTENAIESSGKPFTLNHKWDEKNNSTMFSTCVPISERIITTGDVLTGFLEPQKTFKTILKGDYKFSYSAWEEAYKKLHENGFKEIEGSEPIEVYKVSPHDTPNPSKWVSEIYIPIQ